MPSWLMDLDSVLLRRHLRRKDEYPAEEVQLLDVNPSYAYVRHPNGRESKVSTKDLAPLPQAMNSPRNNVDSPPCEPNTSNVPQNLDARLHLESNQMSTEANTPISSPQPSSASDAQPRERQDIRQQEIPPPRRGTRLRRPRDILDL